MTPKERLKKARKEYRESRAWFNWDCVLRAERELKAAIEAVRKEDEENKAR